MVLVHHFTNYPYLTKKILLTLFLILFLGVVLEIWLVNRLSTLGEEISKLQYASEGLRLENQVLKNQIDKLSSLQSISSQVEELGFSKVANIQYLQQRGVALNSNR